MRIGGALKVAIREPRSLFAIEIEGAGVRVRAVNEDDLKQTIAEKAAESLKNDLRKAKALVAEARDRLGRQVEAVPSPSGTSGPATEGGQP